MFAAAPDNSTLEAAGALSSWFGAQASYRGAKFSTHINQIPAHGNVVCCCSAVPKRCKSAVWSSPAAKGPTLSVMTNPNDANGKLLVISGRDAAELKTATTALVLGSQALSAAAWPTGPLAGVLPYDANWKAASPGRPAFFAAAAVTNALGYNLKQTAVEFSARPGDLA